MIYGVIENNTCVNAITSEFHPSLPVIPEGYWIGDYYDGTEWFHADEQSTVLRSMPEQIAVEFADRMIELDTRIAALEMTGGITK